MAILSFVNLVLLCTVGASATNSDTCPSLMLLQLDAQKLGKHRRRVAPGPTAKPEVKALQAVDDLLRDSETVALEVTAQVRGLRSHLLEAQREHVAVMTEKRRLYSKNLTAVWTQIHAAEAANADIEDSINALKQGNSAMLHRATNLTTENDALRKDLRELQTNLSTAQEFVDRALDNANDTETEELKVLYELEARHAANLASKEHQDRLSEVESVGLSLLDMGSAEQYHAQLFADPQSLVTAMEAGFEALEDQQHSSEAALEKLFLDKYAEGSSRLEEVMQAQDRLNATRARVETLHSELEKAVFHLEELRVTLGNKAKQIRLYSGSLSRRPFPDGGPQDEALLQTAAVRGDVEPSTNVSAPTVDAEVLEKPGEVFETVSSQVSALGERLAELHEQHEQSVMKSTAEYEARLKEQSEENELLRAQNEAISQEIAALRSSNSAVRFRAKELLAGNEELRRGLQALMANVSTARDFARSSPENISLAGAPQLEILEALAKEDATRRDRKEHQQRLAEIAKSSQGSKVALLSMEAEPKELIDSMSSNLDDLNSEMKSSSSALKAAFQERFKVGEKAQELLLIEQKHLNDTKNSTRELESRLLRAVDHLVDTRGHLQKRTLEAQRFLVKISDRTPVSTLTAENVSAAALAKQEMPRTSWTARLADMLHRNNGKPRLALGDDAVPGGTAIDAAERFAEVAERVGVAPHAASADEDAKSEEPASKGEEAAEAPAGVEPEAEAKAGEAFAEEKGSASEAPSAEVVAENVSAANETGSLPAPASFIRQRREARLARRKAGRSSPANEANSSVRRKANSSEGSRGHVAPPQKLTPIRENVSMDLRAPSDIDAVARRTPISLAAIASKSSSSPASLTNGTTTVVTLKSQTSSYNVSISPRKPAVLKSDSDITSPVATMTKHQLQLRRAARRGANDRRSM